MINRSSLAVSPIQKNLITLKGHEDSVQDIVFDKKSKIIFTCGVDQTVILEFSNDF